jgi:hypothetical protein
MTGKKKILLVSNGFYPEISPRSYRATELAKEFYRKGHEVVVISKYRDCDYAAFLNTTPITLKMWGRSKFPKVPESKNRIFGYIGRGVSRILLLLFEYPGIEEMFQVKKILRYESGFDLMISFAVPFPVQWGVAWSRTLKHRIAYRWVADCGDPYMGDVLDSFRHPFYFKYLEKWFCRKADYISIPIQGAINGYYQEFHHKIRIIPQGFDIDLDFSNIEKPINDITTFAYAGGFLQGIRDPRALLNYLADSELQFRFIIYTSTPDFLNEYKEKLNEKLVISDYIPRSELMQVLARMDFLINFDNNTTLNSPSKLIDYAISGRPVLNICKNFKSDELMAFIRGDYRSKMKLPDPEQYNIKNISQLFLDLLSDRSSI